MFHGGSLWTGLISGGLSQYKDTYAMTTGQMDKKQFAIQTSQNVTGAIGVMAGLEYGAVLGTSILPGIGTAVGAVIGGVIGDRVGRAVGVQTGTVISNHPLMQNAVRPSQDSGNN
jgi:outer membrane lipoprotein SlyB